MHEAILHNILILLERGAFAQVQEGATLQPMSPHKWRKLADISARLHVMRFVAQGAKEYKEDNALLPVLLDTLEAKKYQEEETAFDFTSAHLFNHWTQKHLEDVREGEMNSHNTSDESLMLLDIIIKNAEYVITGDTSVEGIITMGRFIRDNKEKIDYNKIRQWLAHIGLIQIASMEGNMLIDCMNFNAQELPFVVKPFHRARKLFLNSIIKVYGKHSFSNATRMNVAMLETISHRFMKAISMVTDIEE